MAGRRAGLGYQLRGELAEETADKSSIRVGCIWSEGQVGAMLPVGRLLGPEV
jgi:hypothetical protein